ncbi:Ribosomal subunit interface protein (cold-shock protein) [Magnetospira sp. QH-2]|nr:HPF/RaiA family ribosome-associated protein [Magnetospira sp. QH-2]CCQ75532.1 Ribosomal subunit interface protein (cold-shock protein) [Magnetospira sp. QH-2]
MQIPLQITFRGLQHSDAVEEKIREKVAKLEQFHDGITACRVLVESPHKHHSQGRLYHVRLDISVPGKEIIVKRDANDKQEHEDIFIAVRDAFEAARRQIKEYHQRQRHKVKTHQH